MPQVDEAEAVAKGAAIMASKCFAADPPNWVSAMDAVGLDLGSIGGFVQYGGMYRLLRVRVQPSTGSDPATVSDVPTSALDGDVLAKSLSIVCRGGPAFCPSFERTSRQKGLTMPETWTTYSRHITYRCPGVTGFLLPSI